MVFLKVSRNCLICCMFTAAAILPFAGISAAEEGQPPPVTSQTPDKAASEPFPHTPPDSERGKAAASGSCYRIDAASYACYEKPRIYGFMVNAPLDIADWLHDSFQKKNALTIAGLAVATGGLLAVDQDLYRMTRDVGHSLHISGESELGRVAPGSPIQYPKDLGTALYYLGDGMIPLSITAGMFGYGMVTSDVRSLQTSSQLAEGLLSVAIVVQTIKRVTGRETPGEATGPGGKWRFFPSFREFAANTPRYDAFPSGHLATGIMTITVLADNYPEYPLIRPVGYGLMTLLSFQMINNGVHWVSDYPLAIAIGYGLGKAAVSHGRKVVSADGVPEKASKSSLFNDMVVFPMPLDNGGTLVVVGRF